MFALDLGVCQLQSSREQGQGSYCTWKGGIHVCYNTRHVLLVTSLSLSLSLCSALLHTHPLLCPPSLLSLTACHSLLCPPSLLLLPPHQAQFYREDPSTAQAATVLKVGECAQLARLVLCVHLFSYDFSASCTCVMVCVYMCVLNAWVS